MPLKLTNYNDPAVLNKWADGIEFQLKNLKFPIPPKTNLPQFRTNNVINVKQNLQNLVGGVGISITTDVLGDTVINSTAAGGFTQPTFQYPQSGDWVTTGWAFPSSSPNTVLLWPFTLDGAISVKKLAVACRGTSGLCDVGIYDILGNLKVDVGPQAFTTGSPNTLFDLAVVTPATLQPGAYFFSITASGGALFTFYGVGAANAFVPYGLGGVQASASSTTSTGAQLPTTIVIPAIAPVVQTNTTGNSMVIPGFLLH